MVFGDESHVGLASLLSPCSRFAVVFAMGSIDLDDRGAIGAVDSVLVGPSEPEVDRIVPTTDATLWVDRGPGRGSEAEPRRHCGAIRI